MEDSQAPVESQQPEPEPDLSVADDAPLDQYGRPVYTPMGQEEPEEPEPTGPQDQALGHVVAQMQSQIESLREKLYDVQAQGAPQDRQEPEDGLTGLLGPIELESRHFDYNAEGDVALAKDLQSLSERVAALSRAIGAVNDKVGRVHTNMEEARNAEYSRKIDALSESIQSAVSEFGAGASEEVVSAAVRTFGNAVFQKSNGVIAKDFVKRCILAYKAAYGGGSGADTPAPQAGQGAKRRGAGYNPVKPAASAGGKAGDGGTEQDRIYADMVRMGFSF